MMMAALPEMIVVASAVDAIIETVTTHEERVVEHK